MYLKQIIAQGFKSFADKTVVDLEPGITGIVGPNGSGKSNIVDAVRWVLGEQSVKSLRGEGAMTDVIFSGSKSRNPSNHASVSLIFDNTKRELNIDFSEVEIKRMVYNSGENEYYINKDKCRLKDILDLFIDSGAGKESFNIISQGEVQKILSNSPSDRRVIFEEAAGVLKYKKRKEEAIRKLDRTHNNLDRVNDIINELQIQIEPLKEQSIKAKEYLENKNGLDKIEVALISYEIEQLNYEYQSSKQKIEELNNQIMSLSTNSSGEDAKIDQEKVSLLKLEKDLEELQKQLLEITKEEEKLNGEKKILQERSKYDAKDQKVYDNISLLTEKKLKLETEVDNIKNEDNSLRLEYDSLTDKLNDLNESLKSKKNERDNLYRELSYKNKEKIELDNKISVLANYIENGGGLTQSVKSIFNNPKLTGIHDIIGNLIDCDEEYAKALEVALGASKQFLVVENEEIAKESISYLKNNRLGRCTFFPLNIIKAKSVDYATLDSLKNDNGFINTFDKLVRFDKKYNDIIANQLGNVLVTDNIDSANRIAKKINQRYKIVTLDGEIIHVGGSITGGNVNIGRSIITDKFELEKLNRIAKDNIIVIKDLENNIKELEDDINKQEEIIYKEKTDHITLAETRRNKQSLIDNINIELEDVDKELKGLGHVTNSSLSEEETRIMNEYYDTVKNKNEIVNNIKQITKEKDNLKATIDELEAKNRIHNSSLKGYEKELKELEINVNRMDVKLDNYLNTLSEDYELTFEKAKENYVLDIEVEEARRLVNTYKTNIKRIGMVNLDSINEYEKVSERYNFLDNQRNDLLNAKEQLLEIITEMDTVMEEEFLSTFKSVEKEFEQVFKQLFNGGKATLKLTDPSNILETGVDIIASPPGKKLTTISLLSGGEKTLTAISLLFAILNVRTVPFCLFDEVEAALDEANVDNFGRYLDHYKEKTQFLLITHKKKTMEYANTLYGITMQESGVSKLVSVKLENSDKYLK